MKKSFDISKYLKEHTITVGIVDQNIMWLNESEDDKYTHVGYGHYKLKGKEKDANATVFSKEGNKYVPTKPDEPADGKSKAEPAKPKVNIFDKPKEKTYKPKFKKDAVVYNKNTNTVGIVRMSGDTYGEVKTDADGNVDIDSLEPYNPKIHKNAKITPSTKKEIETRQQTKTSKSKVVPSTKLQSLMPKSNPKTFSGNSDINKISPKQKREISMKIDELDRISKEARAKGEHAPNFNLCKITVPGTNLYCDQNLGVPREEMPQFKGKPQPGSPASKMKMDAGGEVDTEPLFKKMLVKKGIKTYNTEIPSDALKATQSELVGAKVAGMTKALEEDPNNPGITAPIYVSRDGYVIDGHHRWAAVTSMAISQGKPTKMTVIVIDDDARNIIPMANKFAEEIGVAAKKADANQEGPTVDVKSLSDQRAKLVKRQDILASKQSVSPAVKRELDNNNQKIKDIDNKIAATKQDTSSKQVRNGDAQLNKFTQKLAKKAGITPEKLGKEKYQKVMAQAAVEALTDANFHDEARKLVAVLENKPEFAEDPSTRKDYIPYGKPGYEDFRKTTAWSSEYFNPDENITKFADLIAGKSDYEGANAIDAIASDLKRNGFNDMASKIQSVVENKKSASLINLLKELSLNENRSLSDIAREISSDWKPVNYAAKPYLSAMHSLDKITDKYGMDSAKSVVLYFLSNAGSWRGETAKRIKAELKKMLK